MVVGGCHKVGGGGEVGSLRHDYSLSDMADVAQPLNTVEDSFTSTNTARVEICACQKEAWFGPRRWQWYTYNWCPHCGRKLSPIA